MILYSAASLYHLLCFSVHKMTYYKKKKSTLIIADNIFSKSGMKELVERINDSGIFYRVVVLAFTSGQFQNEYPLNESSTNEMVKQNIAYCANKIEEWLKEHEINLEDYAKIYTANDHRLFGMYLIYKKIPYYYFEDGSGLLSRREQQMEFHKKVQYESYLIIEELKGLGANEYVIEKYANTDTQLPGFQDKKMVDFKAIELFANLSEAQQLQIFKMFNVEKLVIPEGERTVLFLSRFARYLQKPTVWNHQLITSTILDLFGRKSTVVIKPHPRDFSGGYSVNYPNTIVLERTFPSELLPFLYHKKFDKIITVGSTAIDSLKDSGEMIIKLEEEFENHIDMVFPYYGAIILVKELEKKGYEVVLQETGCYKEVLYPLCEEYLNRVPEERNCCKLDHKNPKKDKSIEVIFVDEGSQVVSSNEGMIIYFNSNQKFDFYHDNYEVYEHMEYVDVSIYEQEKSNRLSYSFEDYLNIEKGFYVDTQNRELRQIVREYSYSENLSYMKAVLSINKSSDMEREYRLLESEMQSIRCCREYLKNLTNEMEYNQELQKEEPVEAVDTSLEQTSNEQMNLDISLEQTNNEQVNKEKDRHYLKDIIGYSIYHEEFTTNEIEHIRGLCESMKYDFLNQLDKIKDNRERFSESIVSHTLVSETIR